MYSNSRASAFRLQASRSELSRFAERATFILQRIEKLTNIIIFGLGFCLALAGSVL
jgi:hypothetical protein